MSAHDAPLPGPLDDRLLPRLAALGATLAEPDALARAALEAIVAALDARAGALFLVEGDQLVRRAGIGPPIGAAQARFVSGDLRAMAEAGVRKQAGAELGLDDPPPCVVATVVLRAAGAGIGLLHVARPAVDGFEPARCALLAAAADVVGPALEAAWRGGAAARRDLSVLQRVSLALGGTVDLAGIAEFSADLATELTGADLCGVFVDDGFEGPLRISAFRPKGTVPPFAELPREILAGVLARGPGPIVDHVDDADEPYRTAIRALGVETTVTLALSADSGVVGLFAFAFRDRRPLSRATLNTLTAVAELQAAAIDRARAHAAAERRARLSDAIRRVAERALAATGSERLHEAILDGLVEMSGSRSVRLALVTEDGEIRAVRTRDPIPALATVDRVAFHDPSLAWIRQLAGPTEVRSPSEMPTGALSAALTRAGVASVVLLPLRRGGRLFGVLVSSSLEPRRFHPDEMKALGLLASVAAAAIDAERVRRAADRERARLGDILEALPVSVLVVDGGGRVQAVNARVRRSTPNAAPGVHWEALIDDVELAHVDGRPMTPDELPLSRALRSEEPAPTEVRVRGAGGTRYVMVQAVTLRDDEGNVNGAVNIGQDVTALRELAESRDRVLRVATHELANPLQALHGVVSRLSLDEDLDDPARRAELIARLNLQMDRVTRLVHDLQDMERLRTGALRLQRDEVDLCVLARDAVDGVSAQAEQHRLELRSDGPVRGRWDRVRLAQVLTNLLSNAVRYSPPGSAVRLAVRAVGGDALLCVEDEGIGIPPSQQRLVFEPGYRGSEATRMAPGGSGLGLYVTHEIVRRHGGRIDVDSEPGRGTRFTVVLPREPPPDPRRG